MKNQSSKENKRGIDLKGMVFGRLTVLEVSKISKSSETLCLCRCVCGNVVQVKTGNLKSGRTKSCGCLRKEVSAAKLKSHGCSRSKEYDAWMSMKQRCSNPHTIGYQYYGERGIVVCSEWINDFGQFLKDMGPRPSPNHSIDRINVNGNYEPSNCRWATQIEQHSNTRRNVKLPYMGQTKTVSEWARELKIGVSTIHRRFILGWSVERALSTPPAKSKRIYKKKSN